MSTPQMLRCRAPKWSLASELRYLGCEWAHVQVLTAERRIARWCTLGEALELQPALDELRQPVYLTLNHSSPAGRRSPQEFGSGNWLRNADVSQYTVLPFDCDPLRANGIKESPSTAVELERAAGATLATVDWLRAAGVPDESMGLMCSGNGFWAMVRCALPATPRNCAVVQGLLARWKESLEPRCPGVSLDAGNFDPRRVGPFLGLIKRKGLAAEDRPYRQSYWVQGDGSRVLTADDCRELLQRVGGEPAEIFGGGGGAYVFGLTETTLDQLGYERVFAALGCSPRHCQWCGHRAPDSSSTVRMLGNLQSCLRGTCRSMGRNQRSLARVCSMKLWGDDDWRAREQELRCWINRTFDRDLPVVGEGDDDVIF